VSHPLGVYLQGVLARANPHKLQMTADDPLRGGVTFHSHRTQSAYFGKFLAKRWGSAALRWFSVFYLEYAPWVTGAERFAWALCGLRWSGSACPRG
jgi:hypothetical protein